MMKDVREGKHAIARRAYKGTVVFCFIAVAEIGDMVLNDAICSSASVAGGELGSGIF